MKREYELKRRLRSAETLGQAVAAMKSLSAHHFREARRAVGPARVYREGVQRMLAFTGAELPAGSGAAGLLVLGGELGLCGAYNVQVVAAAAKHRTELGAGPTLCVGHRAAALLDRHGVTAERVHAAPTGVRGITELVLRLAEEVLTTFVDKQLASFDIVSSRFGGVGVQRPTPVRLLPLQAPRSASSPPARYVAPGHLASVAAREFLYIMLYDLLLDALASEHSARLVATEAAGNWLDDRKQGLRRHLAAARREASTQEMIEIAAGTRARARAAK